MATSPKPVVNVDESEEKAFFEGEHYGGTYRELTPFMKLKGGSLGLNLSRMPPGRVGCPFHYHMLEDEIFYVLSGTGTLRYGEELFPLRPGDCISCPAGTKIAHQIANTGQEDLVYLGIGPNHPNEVCVYPDSNKIMVRAVGTVGTLQKTAYMHGEPDMPKALDGIPHNADARQ